MGGVSVDSGGKGGRRSLDSEINMIPMIDLLMVTISFLLITAVWTHMSRINASISVVAHRQCLAHRRSAGPHAARDKRARKVHVIRTLYRLLQLSGQRLDLRVQ